MALLPTSIIPVPLLFKSRRSVPLPPTELTVTSIVVPLPAETDAIVPVGVPVVVREKSLVSTPLTLSLNVTRNTTLAALVVCAAGVCRLIDETVGAVVSTSTPVVVGGVKVNIALLPAASLIVPAFSAIGEADAMPSASASPATTV